MTGTRGHAKSRLSENARSRARTRGRSPERKRDAGEPHAPDARGLAGSRTPPSTSSERAVHNPPKARRTPADALRGVVLVLGLAMIGVPVVWLCLAMASHAPQGGDKLLLAIFASVAVGALAAALPSWPKR
jgi:hypothetical protein